MSARPIGVFDSGLGGLTVLRSMIDLLPGEPMLYFGDTGRFPYGPKPHDEVLKYALEIADVLVARDAKLLVVACNSATSVALDVLRERLDIPVVGVIEPGLRAAARASRTGRIGVIGTVGTVASGSYQRAARAIPGPVDLTCAACPGFVEFVESGDVRSDQVHVLAERLLAPVQGCPGRHACARLHALPPARPYDWRRNGAGGRADLERRRDGVHRPGARRRARPRRAARSGGAAHLRDERRHEDVPGARRTVPRSGGGDGGGLVVELTVLGCSGSFNAPPAGPCSGYLLRHGSTAIWMDCGNGTFAHLQEHVAVEDLDAVVITHEHPDHCADVYGLHVLMRFGLERTGFPIYGPEGIEGHLGQLVDGDWGNTFEWNTIDDADEGRGR